MTFTEPILAAPLLKPTDKHDDITIYKAMKALKKWPVMATLKKDGIRGLMFNELLSRRLKLIPNESIRHRARLTLQYGFDMELFNPALDYNTIQSIVMSESNDRCNEIQFHVLDSFFIKGDYLERCSELSQQVEWLKNKSCFFENPTLCHNADELFAFEKKAILENGEGICFRTPDSPYKNGRSTLTEQYLIKLARYVYNEAVIIGFKEQFENTNTKRTNEVGKAQRSKHNIGMKGKCVLGAFLVRDNATGQEFSVGGGVAMTDKFREEVFRDTSKLLGKTIVYKSKPFGMLIKPRSPQYWGLRKDT